MQNLATVPATETAVVSYTPETNYAVAPIDFASGTTKLTKKSEIKLPAFIRSADGQIERNDEGAPVVERDEAGGIEIEGAFPDTFASAADFLDAISGLSEIGSFQLRASWPLQFSDDLAGPVHWDFKPGKDGAPGQIIASIAPTLDAVLADESLLRSVVPQGISDNIKRLHALALRLLSSAADKAGQIAALDLSPAALLRAHGILTERKAGSKTRQLFAVAVWLQTIKAFAAKIEASGVSGPKRMSLDRFVAELAMYKEQPENLLRMVSSHDGIRTALGDGMIPEQVIKAVDTFTTRLLDSYARVAPDDEGKIIFAPATTKRGNAKRISLSEVQRLVKNRPTTSFAMASLNIGDDDELLAILSDAPDAQAVDQVQRVLPVASLADTVSADGAADGQAPTT